LIGIGAALVALAAVATNTVGGGPDELAITPAATATATNVEAATTTIAGAPTAVSGTSDVAPAAPATAPTTAASTAATDSASATTTAPATTEVATTTITATTLPPTTAPPTTPVPAAPAEITVGHKVGLPPFQSRDSSGSVIGFEVDLVEELADRLGSEATWVEASYTELLDGTAAGAYDIAVGGLIVADHLADQMLFTKSFFDEQYGLIVAAAADAGLTSFADLTAADRIGVTAGTTAELWAEANLGSSGVQIVRIDDPGATNDALDSGDVDGLVSAVMYRYISSGRLELYTFVDVAPTGNVYAFGVDPAQPELQSLLDATFDALVADGTYQMIYDRWFADSAASVAP
jgi:polar amino acid transport system substrate-binding protein